MTLISISMAPAASAKASLSPADVQTKGDEIEQKALDRWTRLAVNDDEQVLDQFIETYPGTTAATFSFGVRMLLVKDHSTGEERDLAYIDLFLDEYRDCAGAATAVQWRYEATAEIADDVGLPEWHETDQVLRSKRRKALSHALRCYSEFFQTYPESVQAVIAREYIFLLGYEILQLTYDFETGGVGLVAVDFVEF